jgi:hypothetical protein
MPLAVPVVQIPSSCSEARRRSPLRWVDRANRGARPSGLDRGLGDGGRRKVDHDQIQPAGAVRGISLGNSQPA